MAFGSRMLLIRKKEPNPFNNGMILACLLGGGEYHGCV